MRPLDHPDMFCSSNHDRSIWEILASGVAYFGLESLHSLGDRTVACICWRGFALEGELRVTSDMG